MGFLEAQHAPVAGCWQQQARWPVCSLRFRSLHAQDTNLHGPAGSHSAGQRRSHSKGRLHHAARLNDDVSDIAGDADTKKAVLDSMITEELAVQRGIDLNMPADDVETRSALVAAVRDLWRSEILAIDSSENELKAYFTAPSRHYADEGRMELHALLMPAGDPAVRWRRSKRYEGGNRLDV